MENIPIDTVLPYAQDMLRLHDAVTAFFVKSGGSPVAGSPAELELRGHAKPGLLRTETGTQLVLSEPRNQLRPRFVPRFLPWVM